MAVPAVPFSPRLAASGCATDTSYQGCQKDKLMVCSGRPPQDAPTAGERFRDRHTHKRATPIKGVRMGAGERSYLVREDAIDVLKNVHGGVQVRRPSQYPPPCSLNPVWLASTGVTYDAAANSKEQHEALLLAYYQQPAHPATWKAAKCCVCIF